MNRTMVDIVGFSRGGILAIEFANRVAEEFPDETILAKMNLTSQPMQRPCPAILLWRWASFSATNPSRREGKIAYVQRNIAEWRRAVASPPPSKNRT